jgi:hypothetical protein
MLGGSSSNDLKKSYHVLLVLQLLVSLMVGRLLMSSNYNFYAYFFILDVCNRFLFRHYIIVLTRPTFAHSKLFPYFLLRGHKILEQEQAF